MHTLDGRRSGVFGSAMFMCMKLSMSVVIDAAMIQQIFLNVGMFAVTVDRSFE